MSKADIPDAAKPKVAELTLRVIVLGIVLAVVMGAANVYLGLKVGMTVSASIPAAVIGMLILRKFFRNGTILEANQVQTAASAGESLAAGIIFTVPALVLIGVWSEFDWLTTTAIAFAGGVLGILFMIPMRRVFVINAENATLPLELLASAATKAWVRAPGSRRGSGRRRAGLVRHATPAPRAGSVAAGVHFRDRVAAQGPTSPPPRPRGRPPG